MLNILPENVKSDIKLNHIYLKLKKGLILSAIIILLPTILLLANYFLLNNIQSNWLTSNNLSTNQQDNITAITNKIINYNQLIQKTTQIQAGHYNPVILISHFSSLIPEGVVINHLDISIADKTIAFSGYADSRDKLIDLENNFSQDDLFSNFAYPISNLTEKENIYFDLEGQLNLSAEIIKKYAN